MNPDPQIPLPYTGDPFPIPDTPTAPDHKLFAPARIPALYGWTCPRCGRGLSPFTPSCPCVPPPYPTVTC